MTLMAKYMLVSMPYMFCRKWIVLRDKKYGDTEILYTDKMLAAMWSSTMAIYSFPIYMLVDIRRFEKKTRNIECEENKLTNFMDILLE